MMKHIIALAMSLLFVGDAMAAPRFVHGHNVCGRNVMAWRKAHGLRVPAYPAVAGNWLTLPRSQPHHGAVLVINRGHGRYHVSIGMGAGLCLNPSASHQRWDTKPCDSIWRGHSRSWRS